MQIRVIINGAFGKMGAIACKTIIDHPTLQLAAQLGRDDNLERTIAEIRPDIVVDLTCAESVYENSKTIINGGAHPVIGASGLRDEEIQALQHLCSEKKLGGIVVPNFSISAVLMMRFAADAARILPEVEIIETHHQQKLDAPSGTAIKTADMIADARQGTKNQLSLKESLPHARGAVYRDVNIHSLRLPGTLAQQCVIFGNAGETLTISHNSIDRSSFMPGLVLACLGVQQLDTLYYGLEHLID